VALPAPGDNPHTQSLTIRAAVLVAFAALVAAGCGAAGGLDELKGSGKPYFYVGTSFDGLDLTHVDIPTGKVASFIYGEPPCEPTDDSGCPSPLEIQNRTCGDGRVVVVLYGYDGHPSKAAQALRPLNDAGRRAGPPDVSFDHAPAC
jgi:hypothetical protein